MSNSVFELSFPNPYTEAVTRITEESKVSYSTLGILISDGVLNTAIFIPWSRVTGILDDIEGLDQLMRLAAFN